MVYCLVPPDFQNQFFIFFYHFTVEGALQKSGRRWAYVDIGSGVCVCVCVCVLTRRQRQEGVRKHDWYQ